MRAGRGIDLTPTGHLLAERLGTVFSGLQSSLDDVIGGNKKTLRLAVCSSFGPGWLIPRLASFHTANPDIDIQLRLYAQDPELTDQVADAFVTALPVSPGYTAIHIVDERLVAVKAREPHANCEHERSRLITTDTDDGKVGQDWLDYCTATRLRLADIQMGRWLQCTHYTLALEMAKMGLGVALVPDFLAAREIEIGSVVYLNPAPLSSHRRYHLCFKKSRAQQDEIKALVSWMKAAAMPQPAIRLVHRNGG
jgi:LysR family glycine cleavage system transcriptional activator